jgi:PTS system nitrogen regulatory IIA component
VTIAPIGHGFALPHLSMRVTLGRESGVVALLLLSAALPLADLPPDDQPVTRMFFFIAPSPRAHLDLLARLSGALTRGPLREVAQRAGTDMEILAALAESDALVTGNPGEARA